MKLQEAVEIIGGKPKGFMVAFEHVRGAVVASDHFPDVQAGEDAIASEEEAWALATLFAAKTRRRCVNIYVIKRDDYTPVANYRNRMIENR